MRNLRDVSAQSRPTGQVKGGPGADLKHESAHKHVSGEALYTDDMPAPGNVLHAYVGLADIAHGKVKRLDLDAVLAAEGVQSVLTLDDVPGHTDIGPVFPGDPLLADGEVQFWGQPLFAVAATSYDRARKAARLATVEYEALEAVLTIEQGLAAQSFVRPSHTQQRGDATAALAQADNVLCGEIQIGGQEQMYLEGQASLVLPMEDG